MTRINSAIKPHSLTDQHLLAELRELPRIFTAVKKRTDKGVSFSDVPKKFTLGAGHCKFFYDKCKFLADRHFSLRCEYIMRFNRMYDFNEERASVSGDKFNDYQITEEEKKLLIERMSERINDSNQTPRYYGKSITKQEAINILNS